MVSIFMITLSSLLLSIYQNCVESKQCYAESNFCNETYSWFTSYPFSRRSEMKPPKDCEFIHVWGLVRHGTRYPCGGDIKMMRHSTKIRDKIISNHKKKRGELCKKDLKNLKQWKTNAPKWLELQLTYQGIKDILFFAKNVKKTFPIKLNSLLPDRFEFLSSNTSRSKDTAIVFTNALMETHFESVDGNDIKVDEKFLNFEKHCPRYKEQTKKKSYQASVFRMSDYFKKMIRRISKRLGYKKPLPIGTITSMYLICAYEKAWFPDSKPPFCAAFSLEDLKVLEYHLDMKMYYKRGYGNPLAKKVGCMIVRDMMKSLSTASLNDYQRVPGGRFLFTHSETILPTTVALGLSKDAEPPSADNFPTFLEHGKWKTAYFDGFTANIIAAMYKCPSEKGLQNVVMFYQNEYPAVIPQCTSNPCTLEELQSIFQDVLSQKECNTEFCNATTRVENKP